MAFQPKQYTKEINGNTYVAQFNGLAAALDANDLCVVDGTDRKSTRKLSEYVLKNVIVNPPNLEINDFEDLETFNAVLEFGSQVMTGKFRPEEKQK